MSTQTRARGGGGAVESGNGAATETGAPVTIHRGPAPSGGTVAETAQVAARTYAPEEVDEQANAIMAQVQAKLEARTERYVARASEMSREPRPQEIEITEPIGPTWPPYPYWNLLLYGPFQPFAGPGGPFLPAKIIRGTLRRSSISC